MTKHITYYFSITYVILTYLPKYAHCLSLLLSYFAKYVLNSLLSLR